MSKGMSLDEFKNALASDATIENEKLKEELETTKSKADEKIKDLENELTEYKEWCRQLSNRCYAQTGGALCMSCGIHCCDHAFTEADYEAAVKYMTRNKMPRNTDTYVKVAQFMQDRRKNREIGR